MIIHPSFSKYGLESFVHLESPVWDDRCEELFFVDIESACFCSLNSVGEIRVLSRGHSCTSISLTGSGDLLYGGVSSLTLWYSSESFVIPLKLRSRLNEAKVDSSGRLWIASMDLDERSPTGALFLIGLDGSVREVKSGLIVGNGIGWSGDDTRMYLTDSRRGEIYIFDYKPETAELSNQRLFARVPKEFGLPDGLAVDDRDGVWSAHFNGSRITRYLPSGEIDFVVHLPVKSPTSLCFGGPNYSELFVTTSTLGSGVSQVLDGCILKLTTDFHGCPSPRFNDTGFI